MEASVSLFFCKNLTSTEPNFKKRIVDLKFEGSF